MLFFYAFIASALANTGGYDLNIELSMNGKHISSPHVIAKEGETASVIQQIDGEKIFMDVITTERPTDKGISMKFVVGKISATGEKEIISTPQVIALENEKAQISVRSKKERVSLTVVASRKAL